ncbi:MAG TPA: alpha/beta hydrolase [Egibacteraceae bacterium]|nr:alpha/beta hydrolase [Egibacteraceae bacterium]
MYAEIVGAESNEPLVLLHGGIGTGHYHWSKQVKTLSEQFRLHLPDLPGHGRTPLPDDGRYDREVQVEAVASYLDDLGGPVHVAGFSMGGHALLALAARRPELFASLTLIGVSVAEHAGLDGWRHKFDPDELERDYPVWAKHLSRIHEPLGGADAWKDVCRRDSKGLEVDVDVDALDGVSCPVLLVRGDRDPAVDPTHYQQLRKVWPHADEFVVPAGAHDVQLTRARVVAPVLLEFLQRAQDAGPADAA